MHLFLVIFLSFIFQINSFAITVQDDARLLTVESKAKIEELAQALQVSHGIHLFFLIQDTFQLDSFDKDARVSFARFIDKVDDAKGAMLFLQMEKGSRRGRIAFSLGAGLKDSLDRDAVKAILQEMIQSFRKNANFQQKLIDGIAKFVAKLKSDTSEYLNTATATNTANPPKQASLNNSNFMWVIAIIFISFVISLGLFIWSRRKCPRCGSKLYVNIRPLARSESRYKRVKIVKCFDCNYFRKYLF